MTNPPPAASTVDEIHADVGIVSALYLEVAPLLDKLQRLRRVSGSFTVRGGRLLGRRIAVIESGPGLKPAGRAAAALIDAHAPSWVLSVGLAGGLRSDLHRGDIVLADSVCLPSGELLSLDLKAASDPTHGLHVGRLVSSDHIVRSVEEKQSLADATGAIAVDMETHAVARVCSRQSVRFLAVRVISDDMSTDLPPEVLTLLGKSGAVRAGAVLGALWKRPSSLSDLWKLRESAHASADKLCRFLEHLIPQLDAAPAPGVPPTMC